MKKRIAALVLALLTILSVLAACAETKEPGKETVPPGSETEGETAAKLGVPEELDYDGRTFTVLTCPGENQTTEIYWTHFGVEEETADDLNDGVYRANARTEAYLNIEFENDTSGSLVDTSVYRQHIAADDGAFDEAIWIDRFALALAEDGMVYSMNDLADYHVDLDQPWWYATLNEYLSIDNKLYLAAGYSDISLFGGMAIMLFNKTIATDLQLGNIYQMVYDGTWDFDTMYTMMTSAAKELDGDQKMTDADQWGAVWVDTYWNNPFHAVNGVFIIDKDEYDMPYLSATEDEDLYNIWEFMLENFHDPACSYDIKNTSKYSAGHPYENVVNMFADNKALFTGTVPFYLYLLREKADYGIIPFPKTEAVEPGTPYYTYSTGIVAHFAPSTTKDPEFTSAVLETTNYYYYKDAIPNYLDVVLAYKQTRDDDSANMLDMAIKYRRLELGQTFWFDSAMGAASTVYGSKNGVGVFASTFDSYAAKIESAIERTVDMFEKLG
ncbi:MAG: hypothetical protein MJ070_00925 [Lachnospiraceae bacterium]|nr:hypothetical protein [Lachnospiraceae bacterium]